MMMAQMDLVTLCEGIFLLHYRHQDEIGTMACVLVATMRDVSPLSGPTVLSASMSIYRAG